MVALRQNSHTLDSTSQPNTLEFHITAQIDDESLVEFSEVPANPGDQFFKLTPPPIKVNAFTLRYGFPTEYLEFSSLKFAQELDDVMGDPNNPIDGFKFHSKDQFSRPGMDFYLVGGIFPITMTEQLWMDISEEKILFSVTFNIIKPIPPGTTLDIVLEKSPDPSLENAHNRLTLQADVWNTSGVFIDTLTGSATLPIVNGSISVIDNVKPAAPRNFSLK